MHYSIGEIEIFSLGSQPISIVDTSSDRNWEVKALRKCFLPMPAVLIMDINSELGNESLEKRLGRPYENAYLCNLSVQFSNMTSSKRFDAVTPTLVMRIMYSPWGKVLTHPLYAVKA